VWVYTKCREADSASWERKWVLKQHDLVVSGMDWHPVTHKLVTCSHDRSAFVWVMEGGEFLAQPQVVILPHRMACLDVKWSPDGAKFAVASGSKKALIAFYEPSNNWWVAREGRKHKSTVLAVAWHPSSQLLATVATDYVCRVSSAYVEGVDSAPWGASMSTRSPTCTPCAQASRTGSGGGPKAQQKSPGRVGDCARAVGVRAEERSAQADSGRWGKEAATAAAVD
jgi:actin related protein 2/3 complex subunit 1A/1B